MALVIGLTGGIGAGKSTVAALLGDAGATVVDVDGVGRAVLEPDGAAFSPVIETFGPSVLAPDGRIDRAALATIVFGGEDSRLAELEAISHPAINAHLRSVLAGVPRDAVVVLDMAVLVGSRLGWQGSEPMYRRVIVVEAPIELRIHRLAGRGMSGADARRRIAAQPDDVDRRRVADVIITNDADLDVLGRRVQELGPTIDAWRSQ